MSDEISVDDERTFVRRQMNAKPQKSEPEKTGPSNSKKAGSWLYNVGRGLTGGPLEDIRARKYGSAKKRVQA